MGQDNHRLLFLTAETWPTFRVDVSVLFGKYLPRQGVFADIVTARAPNTENEVGWGGGDAILCDVGGGQARKHICMLFHGIRQSFKAKRGKYRAIQVRDMPILACFALLAARLKHMRFYYWMSYPMSEGQIHLARERGLSAGLMKFLFPWLRGRIGKFLLYRFVLPLSDHVFVQSEQMEKDLHSQGIDSAKMTPVPMGVDDDLFGMDVAKSSDVRLANKSVITYLGTLDRPRHIENLFEMLSIIKRTRQDVILVLAGDTEDGVHREWLRERAKSLGVDGDIVWTGWLNMRDAWQYVKAADVALSPFPRGFLLDSASPTKVSEYLALGVPVVCNDNPDQRSVISSSGAGLCVEYSAEAFARAVLEILGWDADTRSAAMANGRRYVEENRKYSYLAGRLASQYFILAGQISD